MNIRRVHYEDDHVARGTIEYEFDKYGGKYKEFNVLYKVSNDDQFISITIYFITSLPCTASIKTNINII